MCNCKSTAMKREDSRPPYMATKLTKQEKQRNRRLFRGSIPKNRKRNMITRPHNLERLTDRNPNPPNSPQVKSPQPHSLAEFVRPGRHAGALPWVHPGDLDALGVDPLLRLDYEPLVAHRTEVALVVGHGAGAGRTRRGLPRVRLAVPALDERLLAVDAQDLAQQALPAQRAAERTTLYEVRF